MRKFIIIISITLYLFPYSSVFACTPLYFTAKEQFDRSDIVIEGLVKSVSATKNGDYRISNATVEVKKVWKGNEMNNIKIKSYGIYTCPTAFAQNAENTDYLIFGIADKTSTDTYIIEMTGMSLLQSDTAKFTIKELESLSNSTTTSYKFKNDLKYGSNGDDVVALQTLLEKRGFLVIPMGTKKGFFGQLTRDALINFQKYENISPAVGYFGPITRAKINK